MELSCENVDEVDSWKASFLRAGVYPEKAMSSSSGEEVRLTVVVIIAFICDSNDNLLRLGLQCQLTHSLNLLSLSPFSQNTTESLTRRTLTMLNVHRAKGKRLVS